jgi:hypothetical protein
MASHGLALNLSVRCERLFFLLFNPKSLLLSSKFTMAALSGKQNPPSHTSGTSPYTPTPRPSTAMRADHANTSKRPEKPTTASIPTKSHNYAKVPKSAPLEVYLRSDEPAARRVKAGFTSHHPQTPSPQAKPARKADIGGDTRGLEAWMAEVTTHPERAMWFRDLDRVPPSTAQLYGALLSDGGTARSGQLRRANSHDSMQPMPFCSCCPPDPTTRRP